MNQTPNYQLNQWERSDRVLMEDFNADNAKIDAALGTKCEVVAGVYIGDGAERREIALGRKPKAVYLCLASGEVVSSSHNYYGGLAFPEFPVKYSNQSIVTITDTGFTVYHFDFGTYSVAASNLDRNEYHYIAFF